MKRRGGEEKWSYNGTLYSVVSNVVQQDLYYYMGRLGVCF